MNPAVSDLWAASQIALWIFLVLLAILVLGLYRQVGELLLPLSRRVAMGQGLEIGDEGPKFTLPDQEGNAVSFPSQSNGSRPTMVIFGSADCPPCNAVAAELRDFAPDSLRVLFVAGPSHQENREFAAKHQARYPVLTDDRGSSTARGYKVGSTPFAYVLDRHGVVRAKDIASTKDALGALVTEGLGKKWVKDSGSRHGVK